MLLLSALQTCGAFISGMAKGVGVDCFLAKSSLATKPALKQCCWIDKGMGNQMPPIVGRHRSHTTTLQANQGLELYQGGPKVNDVFVRLESQGLVNERASGARRDPNRNMGEVD